MEKQLTERMLAEEDAVAVTTQMSFQDTAAISDAELEAILSEAQTDFLHRPVPKKVEIVARISALMVMDIIMVTGAMWVAYWLRYENAFITRIYPPESGVTFGLVMMPLLAWLPFLLLSLKLAGMYDVRTRIQVLDKIPRIFGAVNAYIVSFLLVSFLLEAAAAINRGYLVFFWLSCIVLIFLGRTVLQFLLSMAGISDAVMRKTLIVGSGKVGKEVARKLMHHDGFGLIPVGFLDDDPLYTEFEEPELQDVKVLGGLKDLCRVIKDFKIEKVIVAFSGASAEELLDLASKCNKRGVECSVVPRLFEVITNEISVKEIGGIPLLRIRDKNIKGIDKVLKAMEDYILGGFIFLISLPILLVTAIAIKLDSPGPVFFLHKRVGKNGKCFRCIKFRSMSENAEALQAELVKNHNGEHGWLCWKMEDDPRITRVGKWLRKLSIDELPQIFNVLSGHMSLVGPRPHIKEEVAEYKEWHKQRLNVKPGITGLWQVSGRSDLPFDEMIKLDLYYIERWSLWMDFKVILRTFTAVFRTKGAC
jgi:exopolysaccharide biosynthesis polyprenyl glycosylphosphotransferase